MPDRGKLVVFSFFLVAAVLAGGAMWYHFAKSRWAMAFWGNDAARLIVRAPEVEVWHLADVPPDGPNETSENFRNSEYARRILIVDGSPMYIFRRRPVTDARGLIHTRMALVEDANFDITAKPPARNNWDYALRFYSPDEETVVLIDRERGLVRALDEPANANQQTVASIAPIVSGLKQFLEEQFDEPQKKPEQSGERSKKPAIPETVRAAK